jgi:hypothetical protein
MRGAEVDLPLGGGETRNRADARANQRAAAGPVTDVL